MFRKKEDQKLLITMESEEEYADPDVFNRPRPKPRPEISTNFPQPSIVAYKPKDEKVTLGVHQPLKNKTWVSTPSVYHKNSGYSYTAKTSNAGPLRVLKGPATDPSRIRRTDRTPTNKHHYENNNAKVDSCCNCFCFFLLYILILTVGVGLYFLHIQVYYPYILHERLTLNHTLEAMKVEWTMILKFMKTFCHGYPWPNQTYVKKCKRIFNPDKFVLTGYTQIVFDALGDLDDHE